VPCHAARSVSECLAKHSIPVAPHPPSLLIRFDPLRFLPLPQAVKNPEGETISRHRGDTTKYDTAVAGHSQIRLPDMH
jgi:hypothetical protein